MALERARGSKLAELVAHHVLRDVDGQVTLAVVYAEGQTDHVGRDRRTPRPGLDGRGTRAARANPLHGLLNATVYERTFFN